MKGLVFLQRCWKKSATIYVAYCIVHVADSYMALYRTRFVSFVRGYRGSKERNVLIKLYLFLIEKQIDHRYMYIKFIAPLYMCMFL